MHITVEICCGSVADVVAARNAGADRVELNSALEVGGLTPSPATVSEAAALGIPLFCMLRPRIGSFCYSESEFETMLRDAEILMEQGASGVVSGFLHSDGTLDNERCRKLVELCGKERFVLHRAIDLVPDWHQALDTLIELGVTRVLTSGQAPTAVAGAKTIAEMIIRAQGRIEILPAGGIRPENADQLIQSTGVTQLHASCGTYSFDFSGRHSRYVTFDQEGTDAGSYKTVDPVTARELVRIVRKHYPD